MGFIKVEKDPPLQEIDTSRAKCENPECEVATGATTGPTTKKDDFCLIETQSYSNGLYPCDGSQNIASQCWSFAYEIETRKACLISITAATAAACPGPNSDRTTLNGHTG